MIPCGGVEEEEKQDSQVPEVGVVVVWCLVAMMRCSLLKCRPGVIETVWRDRDDEY